MTIPTLIGVILAIAGLATGLWVLRSPIGGLVRATVEETPQNLKVTNITDNSLVISWTTQKATSGYVQYGEAGKGPDLVVSDDRDQEKGSIGNYFTHLVTMVGLKGSTKYEFRLGSGKAKYDNQGKPYEISTGVVLRNPPAADVAYGQATTAAGEPAEGGIVYISLPGTVPQATLVKSSGSWVIPLATARTTDLTSFAAYDLQNSQEEIKVEGGPLGVATIVITTGKDSPVPEIVLGQDKDYVSRGNESVEPPVVEQDGVSKFSAELFGPVTEATGSGLVLLTPKFGERVNSSQPEIIGKAPAGSTITVEIHSDALITGTTIADKNGNFSYSVPEDLSPGEHTVTISMIVDGIIKKVSKKFVVEAAENSDAPAFSATGSGKLKPSPSPTPTLVPRITYPATESGTPQSGDSTPTLILLILGGGLILSGVFAYKKAI